MDPLTLVPTTDRTGESKPIWDPGEAEGGELAEIMDIGGDL